MSARREEPTGTSARILYRPVGLVSSMIKASVDRGGSRAFQKWTEGWPGR